MGQKNQLWWDIPASESFLLNQKIYEIPEINKEMPKRVRRRYNRFIRLNKAKHDMYVQFYGEACIGYFPWTFKNIMSWGIFSAARPGCRFLNPEETDVEEVNFIAKTKHKK